MKKTIYSLIVTLILLSGTLSAQPLLVSQENGHNNTSNTLANIDNAETNSPFNKLVWSDEFDGYGFVNSANWFHQTQLPNGLSWYNSELQHYTNSASNSFRKNGIFLDEYQNSPSSLRNNLKFNTK